MEHDEVYLIDMWRILAREWRWFVATLVLVLLCTFALTHAVRRQWEATAWIQIAQVGEVPAGQDPKVEPLQRVLERLQLVPFENRVLESAGFSARSPEAGLYRRSLKLDPLPYAGPLIRLSVRGYSRQQASALAMATVTALHAVHQRLEAAPLRSARARLDALQSALQIALADRARLQQVVALKSKAGTGSRAIASLTLAYKNTEIRGLEQARLDLVDRLAPPYTYETSLPWPVYVPDKPAFPNPVLMWGGGILLGLGLGTFAATARNAARRKSPGGGNQT
ncbi:MAG: lipopolysaccharide biosynthesis protein [Rhodanobacter sp.]|nr:MAG: lipopolysaccharide biosynthesis protein [Rhodanobacter sp.]